MNVSLFRSTYLVFALIIVYQYVKGSVLSTSNDVPHAH